MKSHQGKRGDFLKYNSNGEQKKIVIAKPEGLKQSHPLSCRKRGAKEGRQSSMMM